MPFTLRCVHYIVTSVLHDQQYMFGVRNLLDGQKFTSDTEVQSLSAVHQWLGQQPALCFAEGIQKRVYRWCKCLNKFG